MAPRIIAQNEATAALRTIQFERFNTADGTANTTLAAAPVPVRVNGAASVGNTSGNCAHTDDEKYTVQLTQAEVNLPVGTQLIIGPTDTTGVKNVCAVVSIGPAALWSTNPTDANLLSVNGKTLAEPGLDWVGALRLMLSKLMGKTSGGGTTTEVFKGARTDGGTAKTRITETNDGVNRTGSTVDTTDDV